MTAKPVEPGKRIRAILKKNGNIRSIEVSFSNHGVAMRAMPDAHHPIVVERRILAFAERGPSVSMEEATEINNNSMTVPLARGHASDFEGALISFEENLKRVTR